MLKLVDGEIKLVDEPALTALNMRLRDDYIVDCAKGVERWNKIIEKTGVKFRLELPHVAFHRHIGEFKDVKASPKGDAIGEAAWAKDKDPWLPSKADGDFIEALMKPVARARPVRRLDRAAEGRHRQQARRFRIREDRGVIDISLSWPEREPGHTRSEARGPRLRIRGSTRHAPVIDNGAAYGKTAP